MDIETAKALVGAALIVAVFTFSLATVASAARAMLWDLRILSPGTEEKHGPSR